MQRCWDTVPGCGFTDTGAGGKALREIIEEKGTDGFIEVENRVNASIRADRAIIATGGSVVYGKEAMEHLKEIGRVVYLRFLMLFWKNDLQT